VNHHENANQIITMLSNTPHSVALAICPGYKIKIIHHDHHDMQTPVMQEGTDKVWALMGGVASTAASVNVDMTSVHDFEGITPMASSLTDWPRQT
jgi:hypothetical protein